MAISQTKVVVSARCQLFTLQYCSWLQLFCTAHGSESLLSSFNLTEYVNFPTHNKHHILDLVITSSDCSLAPSLSSSHSCPSDHCPVFTTLSINPAPLPPPTLYSFRRFHRIDISSFLTDLKSSCLITRPPISLGSLLLACSPLYLINMLLPSQNSPDVSPHPTPGPALHAFISTV